MTGTSRKLIRWVDILVDCRLHGGRLFIIGIGGSAGNASHMVNDFRKLCHIETYSPVDNFSEFSARVNDDGWVTSFSDWIKVSSFRGRDVLLVLSVGGGNKKVSQNIVEAVAYVKETDSGSILGIVGTEKGYTQENADVCLVVPEVNPAMRTAYSESFQMVFSHCICNHPKLKV